MAKLGLTTLNDAIVWNAGSLYMVRPLTEEALEWLHDNTSEDAPWFGDSLAVEHRYIVDLVHGMRAAGLTVK